MDGLEHQIKKYESHPAHLEKDNVIEAVKKKGTVIFITADTGSGKSTNTVATLTQYAIKNMDSKKSVLCLQPRVNAALKLSDYLTKIAQHPKYMDIIPGYRVRNNNSVTDKTNLIYATDGMFFNYLHSYPEFWPHALVEKFNMIIIDEAHIRSINNDIILSYVNLLSRYIKLYKWNMKIIIMSATINIGRYREFFQGGDVIEMKGRCFPVITHYLRNDSILTTGINAKLDKIIDIVNEYHSEKYDKLTVSDILVFVPGKREINYVINKLLSINGIQCFPFHAQLDFIQRNKIFDACNKRRIIVATNIAETSVTFPNVSLVVDCGLENIVEYDPQQNVRIMKQQIISKQSAKQRRGRAGRTQPGECICLYTQKQYEAMEDYCVPDIRQADLTEAIIQLLAVKIKIEELLMLDPPKIDNVNAAYNNLISLEAVDINHAITRKGNMMAQLNMTPINAEIYIRSGYNKHIAILISALNCENFIIRKNKNEKNENLENCLTTFSNNELKPIYYYTHRGSEHWTRYSLLRQFMLFYSNCNSDSKLKSWCQKLEINYNNIKDATKQANYLLQRHENCSTNNSEAEDLYQVVTAAHQNQSAEFLYDDQYKDHTHGTLLTLTNLLINYEQSKIIYSSASKPSEHKIYVDCASIMLPGESRRQSLRDMLINETSRVLKDDIYHNTVDESLKKAMEFFDVNKTKFKRSMVIEKPTNYRYSENHMDVDEDIIEYISDDDDDNDVTEITIIPSNTHDDDDITMVKKIKLTESIETIDIDLNESRADAAIQQPLKRGNYLQKLNSVVQKNRWSRSFEDSRAFSGEWRSICILEVKKGERIRTTGLQSKVKEAQHDAAHQMLKLLFEKKLIDELFD